MHDFIGSSVFKCFYSLFVMQWRQAQINGGLAKGSSLSMRRIVSRTLFFLWGPAKTMVLLLAAPEGWRNTSLLCKVL